MLLSDKSQKPTFMKKILIVNGHQYHERSKGEYNRTLIKTAEDFLTRNEFFINKTVVDDWYDIQIELEKFTWADIIIFQFPIFWMNLPHAFKKYVDEVYMTGHAVLFKDDGRTDGGRYGTGGKLQGKKYMFSTTWNEPSESFDDRNQFFEGRDVDGVLFNFHKAQQFLGLGQLPTFSCHNIKKAPDIERDTSRFEAHLKNVINAQ